MAGRQVHRSALVPRNSGWASDDQSESLADLIRDEGRRHRLLKQDLDDLTQDVWVWLLRVGPPARITRPWIRAVVRNFVLRHRRLTFRNALRERVLRIEADAAEGRLAGGSSTFRMALDQASARLPQVERRLLNLVRRGFSFAEAANRLRIPRGSQQYFREQLLAHLRRELAEPQGPCP